MFASQSCRSSRFLSQVVLIASVAALACTSWRGTVVAPGAFSGNKHPKEAKVTLASGIKLLMLDPVVKGDSLVATRYTNEASQKTNRSQSQFSNLPLQRYRPAAALADIRLVEVRKFDAVRTILGIGATVAVVALATDRDPPPPPPPAPQAPSGGGSSGGSGGGGFTGGFGTSSCPFVYAWDGKEWRLESGTFGGAIFKALTRTDVDNLDYVVASNGVLRLKLANELAETDFVDALSVLAVDHDLDVFVAPDASGNIYALGNDHTPLSAKDFAGRNALDRVSVLDGWNWESPLEVRDSAIQSEIRDGLELTFLRPAGAVTARLIVDGNNTAWAGHMMVALFNSQGRESKAWMESMEAQPERVRALATSLARESFLGVSVWNGERWAQQGLVWEAGPEVRKRQVLKLDLSHVTGDTVRVRLESIPSFWLLDRVALDFMGERTFTVTEVQAASAVDFRGRDIREQLAAADQREYVMHSGQHAELRFIVPPVPAGKKRSYLIRSTGWYRIDVANVGEPQRGMFLRESARSRMQSRA